MIERACRVISFMTACLTAATIAYSMVAIRRLERQAQNWRTDVYIVKVELTTEQIEQLTDWLKNRDIDVAFQDEILLS